jgi:hypothetical protein
MDLPDSDFSSFGLGGTTPPHDEGGGGPPSDGGETYSGTEPDGGDDGWGNSGIVVSLDGTIVQEGDDDQSDDDDEWIGVTEEMIPKSSEHADLSNSDENRLECMVDGLAAKVFIDDSRMGSPKIVILFVDESPTWGGAFSTKYYLFEDPGVMRWGHDNESMRVLTRSCSGRDSDRQDREFSLVLTKNQHKKGSINANEDIVTPLEESGLIDFRTIVPGRKGKIMRPCTLLIGDEEIETQASFSIPKRRSETSRENRIWPYGLSKLVEPETELFFRATESMLFVTDSIEKLR